MTWRCFHCDETFTDRIAAGEHFGLSGVELPACVEVLTEGEKAIVETKRAAQRERVQAEEEAEKMNSELSAWRFAVPRMHTPAALRHEWDFRDGVLLANAARIEQLTKFIRNRGLETPDYE